MNDTWITDRNPEKNDSYIVSVEWNGEKGICKGVMATQFEKLPISWIGQPLSNHLPVPLWNWQYECFGMKVKAWQPFPKPYGEI